VAIRHIDTQGSAAYDIEVAELLNRFVASQKRVRSKPDPELLINSFSNKEYLVERFPEIVKMMDRGLELEWEGAFTPHPVKKSPYKLDSSFNPGRLTFQMHDVSVGEHTDAVTRGRYFQVCVLDELEVRFTGFDTNAALICYQPGASSKSTVSLAIGTSLVFNPAKPHSMIYYGNAPLLALRTVYPTK
jgi:hypothetical protein